VRKLKNALISLKVSVRNRIPMAIKKKPLTMVITLRYCLILPKAVKKELKAREARRKGIPSPRE
jgi:hypothetical protein